MNQSEVAYRSVPITVVQSLAQFDDAVALYDNQSEGPDELTFKKGDALKILERDFNGMLGWWLCALRDKIGLAPGNRLDVVGSAPDKPRDFRKQQEASAAAATAAVSFKGKTSDDPCKQTYGLYDVPKIAHDQGQQQQQQQQKQQQQQLQQQQHQKQPDGDERRQEIPDILKGQNVQSRPNANQMLNNGPSSHGAIHQEANGSQDDAYLWPEDLSKLPTSGRKNPFSANPPATSGNSSAGKNAPEVTGSARTNGHKVSPQTISVSTYSNLQNPSVIIGENGDFHPQQQHQQHQLQQLQQQQPQFVYSINGVVGGDHTSSPRGRRATHSDSDNYDNLRTLKEASQQMANAAENGTIVATTNNNMSKLNGGRSAGSISIQYYYDPNRSRTGSQTLQHRSRKASVGDRLIVRDDASLPLPVGKSAVGKGKRDRSLRRVRFADQVTSSDTEEWTKNGDPPSAGNGALPLKPILSTANQCRSYQNNSNNNNNNGSSNGNNINSKSGQIVVNGNNNNSSNNNHVNDDNNYNDNYLSPVGDFTGRQNNQAFFYQALQKAEFPDYENPYSEIADQPIYERPPPPQPQPPQPQPPSSIAYISTSSRLNSSDPQSDRHHGKNFTSEYKAVLSGKAGNFPQPQNGNYSAASYANRGFSNGPLGHAGQTPPTPPPPVSSLQKKFDGFFVSSPNRVDAEPEFQMRVFDLPKKEYEGAFRPDDRLVKITPELLNKSRDKIQILANSLDGILSRRNADDADVATVILRSVDVELQFLTAVGERGLRKAAETWSEDLIEPLLQHLEDLRAVQATLALLNRQILELSRDISNVQYCQAFETICVSCALSGQNICHPVHRFVVYLLPKFKFLFPSAANDVGRLAPSPTFNSTVPSSGYSTMTTNQLKGVRTPDALLVRNVAPGRTTSPSPRMESFSSYNGNHHHHHTNQNNNNTITTTNNNNNSGHASREVGYYEDAPMALNGSKLRQTTGIIGAPVRYHEVRQPSVGHHHQQQLQQQHHQQQLQQQHQQQQQQQQQLYSSLPSHSFHGRPLPPAPPYHSSVVGGGQAPYTPQSIETIRNSPNPAGHPTNAARFRMARESPSNNINGIINNNNNNNGGLNGYGNDGA